MTTNTATNSTCSFRGNQHPHIATMKIVILGNFLWVLVVERSKEADLYEISSSSRKYTRILVLTLAFPLLPISIRFARSFVRWLVHVCACVLKRSFIMSLIIIALWTCARSNTIPLHVYGVTRIDIVFIVICLRHTHSQSHTLADPFLVVQSGGVLECKKANNIVQHSVCVCVTVCVWSCMDRCMCVSAIHMCKDADNAKQQHAYV